MASVVKPVGAKHNRVMRFKMIIEYAGTRYSGWQIQQNARTVQGEIARAIADVIGTTDFELYGSGRTDAGVHALAQVAHLDAHTTVQPEMLRRRINEGLPSDINILRIEGVRHRFHARHSAVGRSYIYQVSRRRTAFAKAFVWWVKEELNVERMRAAAKQFVGFHDFRGFSDADPDETSTDVLVDTFDIHEDDDLLVVHVEGSHFLWKMVRRLVGVLVEVGRGGLTEGEAARLLVSADGLPARLTAPASGLFLERVFYEGEPRDLAVRPPVAVLRM
jgi:tRNA pseudouridine38-40 synthase